MPTIEHYTWSGWHAGDRSRPVYSGSPGAGRVGRAGNGAIRVETMDEAAGRRDERVVIR